MYSMCSMCLMLVFDGCVCNLMIALDVLEVLVVLDVSDVVNRDIKSR